MFNRLIKNLPFNPGLINQVSFYAKRLRQESSVRRLGFLFIALTFLVQIFAVVAPPQPSVQASSNDIVNGGFTSQAAMVSYCNSNGEFRSILSALGISCTAISQGQTKWISSRDYNGQLFSMGRTDRPIAGETAIDIPNVGRYYMRYLWGWDSPGTTSHYQAVVGTRSNGTPFLILFNCGNITTVGLPYIPPPPPPPPPPAKKIVCSALAMNVKNGSHVTPGTNIVLHGQASGSNLPSSQSADMYYTFNTTAKDVPSTTQTYHATFNGNTTVNDDTGRIFQLTSPGHYTFALTVKSDLGTASGSATGNCIKDVYVDAEVCKNPNDHDACIIKNKRASNITASLNDANNTTAHAGDVIEYTLSATNTEKYTTNSKFVITENIGDILEYADVINLNGAKLDSNNVLTWPGKDIKPGQTIQVKFTVKVKDPIPATPVSSSDPGSFDMTMTNSYGDTVTIHLPPPTSKIIEQTTTSLPNTGPGTNIAIAVGLTVVVGYFFARSRLLAKELDVIRVEYTSGV